MHGRATRCAHGGRSSMSIARYAAINTAVMPVMSCKSRSAMASLALQPCPAISSYWSILAIALRKGSSEIRIRP